jgi:hypothetical protein
VLNALTLRPLPVPHPDELFFVDLRGPASVPLRFSYRMFDGLRRAVPPRAELAAMSRVAGMQGVVEPGREAESLRVQLVSGDYFSVLDAVTIAGAIGTLFMTACGAGFLPARRASRVDPMVALRNE